MIGAVLLMAAVSAGESAPAGAGPRSALCMSPLPGAVAFQSEGKGAATSSYDDSDVARRRRMTSRHAFVVEVDGQASFHVDQKRGGCVADLAYNGTHVAVLRRLDGSAAGAARFSFERFGVAALELRYDPFYATVQVNGPRHPRRSTAGRVPPAARTERSLGAVDFWTENVTISEQGLRLTFRVPAHPAYRRTMLTVTAAAAPVDQHPAVRLELSGSGVPPSSSSSTCFEANLHAPPFETCTAMAVDGWNDGGIRELVLAIDNLAGAPVAVDLRIIAIDPLER